LATLDREVPVDDNIVSSSRGTGSGTVVPELQPHCTSPIQYLLLRHFVKIGLADGELFLVAILRTLRHFIEMYFIEVEEKSKIRKKYIDHSFLF
jgi:hypothetical protein